MLYEANTLNKIFAQSTAAIKVSHNLIFCLKISNDWDSLISFGSACHNFFPMYLMVSMPYEDILTLDKARLLFSRFIIYFVYTCS